MAWAAGVMPKVSPATADAIKANAMTGASSRGAKLAGISAGMA